MVRLIHCVLILRFLNVRWGIFLIWIFRYFMHLDLITDTRWRLWGLHVHCIRVLLLMYIMLASSWSGTTRVRIDASDPIWSMVWCTQSINHTISWFYVLNCIFSLNVYTTTAMTFMAISTAFVSSHSSCSIWCCKFIAFKRTLSMYRC